MQIDTTKIDERIKKLQELKRLAADPEMVRLLLETVSIDTISPQPITLSQGRQKKGGSKKGDLDRAVKKAVASINHSFTAEAVVVWMQSHGHRFTAKNPKTAVNSVLRKMAKKQQLRIVKAGTGRMPSEYERSPM